MKHPFIWAGLAIIATGGWLHYRKTHAVSRYVQGALPPTVGQPVSKVPGPGILAVSGGDSGTLTIPASPSPDALGDGGSSPDIESALSFDRHTEFTAV